MGFFRKSPKSSSLPEAREAVEANSDIAESSGNSSLVLPFENPPENTARAASPVAPEATENIEERLLREISRLTSASNQPPDISEGASGEPPAEGPEPEGDLERLRACILGREIAQLRAIQRTLDDPRLQAQALSRVITEAILIRSGRDDKLNAVLRPTVEHIFRASVRRNPEDLATQIFPAIGPAIRRSISESFNDMLQGFNRTLEMSFSLRGLKWRLEALRTGRTFSEVVLLHTLVYQVEQIFLIHVETGLLLEHLVGEGVETQDAGLVAGMLTAVEDFARDSFAPGRQANLETLKLGERTIFLKRSDRIYLACVVRGTPPAALPQELQTALDLMAVDLAEELDAFDGRVEPFKRVRRYLEDFLIPHYKERDRRRPLLLRLAPMLTLIAFLGWGVWQFWQYQERAAGERLALEQTILERQRAHEQEQLERRLARERFLQAETRHFNQALELLDSTPGLAALRVWPDPESPWKITCLRDRLAPDPTEILLAAGLPADRFQVFIRPYIALDHEIVQARVQESIELRPSVRMSFDQEQGALVFTGSAPMGWIMDTREKALSIAGVRSVDVSSLNDPLAEELETLMGRVNGLVIRFPVNQDEPISEDSAKLDEAAATLAEMEKLAARMQVAVALVIYGHADSTGEARHNYELSQKRAGTVAARLYAAGSSIPVSIYGLGAQFAPVGELGAALADQDSRRIEFRVHLTRAALYLSNGND